MPWQKCSASASLGGTDPGKEKYKKTLRVTMLDYHVQPTS